MFPYPRYFFRRKNIFAICLSFLLLPSLFTTARAAGEIDPGFNATVFRQPGGTISAVVLQPDGKILVGGNADVFGGVPRRITRLNADGTTDTSFNPPIFAGAIKTIGLQSNGKIIVAGAFTIFGTNISAPIVRLNTDGTLDTTFNLTPQAGQFFAGQINDIDIRPDDKILIGGDFNYIAPDGASRVNFTRLNANGSTDTSFAIFTNSTPVEDIVVQPDGKILGFAVFSGSGTSRFLRRLNADGTQDSSFNALVGATVFAHKIQPDGKILIGGNFASVNNTARNAVARLNPDGSLDETFTGSTNSTQITVFDIEFAADGKILIAGNFINYNGTTTDVIAKLNADGSVDASLDFNRSSDGQLYTNLFDIAPLPNGQIIIAGEGNRLANSGAVLSRINANGTIDTSFRTLIGNAGVVEKIVPQPNGQTLVVGIFGAVNNFVRPGIARVNADGSADTTFNPPIFGVGLEPRVRAAALQPDGKILVGGQFVSTDGTSMLVRLNPDGTRDTTFTAPLQTSGPVYDIVVQPDGKILAGGEVRLTGSGSVNFIVRLNADGSVDNTFQVPAPSGIVRKIVLQPDGKILLGGDFLSFGNTTRFRIARLNADGSVDNSFNPLGGANSNVLDLALQGDGKVVIGGNFTIVNGENRAFLARLNSNGTLDVAFNPTSNSPINAVKIQTDGKILVGGSFTTIAAAARNRLARLNPDGTIDLTFNTGTGLDNGVFEIELAADGKILVGGIFTKYNNTPKISIVRLLNTTAPRAKPFDYNGDGKADLAVFRPSTGFWYIARTTGVPSQNFDATQFGVNGDLAVPADYDGDGKTDVAVWRPADGVWYLMQSTAGFRAVQFGANGDIPVPGDFDGDGRANLAVFRPSAGAFYIARPTGVPSQNFDSVPFGANGDKPIVGADFDGDGRADVAVFRPSDGNWYRINSSNNQFVGVHFGISEDKPVAADYDGDGKTDLAVFRPSDGVWYRINSGTDTFTATQFGISTDRPAPADYDGDGRADLAVFRPSEGNWYLLQSSAGYTGVQFGASGDIPTPNAFVY